MEPTAILGGGNQLVKLTAKTEVKSHTAEALGFDGEENRTDDETEPPENGIAVLALMDTLGSITAWEK